MRMHAAILVTSALASTAAVADGPHITLRVPIQITNLHERITGVLMRCAISGRKWDGSYGRQCCANRRLSIDRGTGNVTVQEAEIPIVVDQNFADPRDVNQYECLLYFDTNAASNREMRVPGILPVAVPTDTGGTTRTMIQLVDTTKPYRLVVGGAIPSQ